MSLRIRRGTEAQRTGVVFDSGELIVTTDEFKLFVGDGITLGGRNIAQNIAGSGLIYNPTTERLDISINVTTDDIPEGTNAQYFTSERAIDAVGAALVNGTHTGITFLYSPTQDAADRIDAFVNLALNDLTDVVISGTPTNGQVLKYNSANSRWEAGSDLNTGGLQNVVEDITPALGGDLDLNSHNITGTGNIDVVGNVTSSLGFFGPATITDLISRGSPTLDTASSHYGITDGASGGWIDINVAKNNWTNELPVVAGDNIGGIRVNALADGAYKIVSALDTVLTADADVTATFPASKMLVGIGNNIDITLFEFNHNGAFIAPIVQTGVYTTLPGTPAKGMIVFNDSTSKFQGYNGTTWVNLN